MFEKLKKRMTTAPVLIVSDNKHKFQIEVNTSGYAIGGVLSQHQTDSSW